MTLQLAEGNRKRTRVAKETKPYIYMPNADGNGNGLYIREDHFDHLPNGQFARTMREIAPYQREVESGLMSEAEYLSSKADRKARRAARADRKKTKSDSKAAARVKRAGSAAGLFNKVLDTAGNLLPGGKQGAALPATDDTPPKDPWYKTTPGMFGIGAGVLLLLGGGYALTRKKKK